MKKMKDWLNAYAHKIEEGETGEKFRLFYRLLSRKNEQINLTRIAGERECYIKHFLDSVAGEKYFPPNASVAEVGSGGGFPSVPLMLLRPDLKFTLIESVGKKCAFLEEVIRELDLPARVINARAEETARDRDLRENFDACCARAVARMNTLCEYCLPLVRVGGVFVAYKGRAEEELTEAKNALSVLGGRVAHVQCYALPEGEGERTLIVAEKKSRTPALYPRGHGKERNKPL